MKSDEQAALEALLRGNFRPFVEKTFSEITGGEPFRDNWHIGAITEVLTDVEKGITRRLIITQPPRSLKSTITSVALPAWVLGRNPTRKIIAASYSQELATKFSIDTRTVMRSAWYRQTFPTCVLSKEKQTEPRGHSPGDHPGTAAVLFQSPQDAGGAPRTTAIKSLWQNNEEALKAIRIAHPDLRDQSGTHYTVLFARICKEQARVAQAGRSAAVERTATGATAIEKIGAGEEPAESPSTREAGLDEPQYATQSTEVTEEANGSTGLMLVQAGQSVSHANGHLPSGIDKSLLPIGVPRRIRDKEHLKAVAQQPCLVCGRSPSHAHHLTFVQPRARGLKTSDEWVVPLCYLHHRELHDRGDERGWWSGKAIDPVSFAENLWSKLHLENMRLRENF